MKEDDEDGRALLDRSPLSVVLIRECFVAYAEGRPFDPGRPSKGLCACRFEKCQHSIEGLKSASVSDLALETYVAGDVFWMN